MTFHIGSMDHVPGLTRRLSRAKIPFRTYASRVRVGVNGAVNPRQFGRLITIMVAVGIDPDKTDMGYFEQQKLILI